MEPVKDASAHAEKLATPRSERGGGNGANLATTVAALRLPTPTVADGRSGPGHSEKSDGGLNLRTAVHVMVDSGEGQLNPDFVEWMMNWPVGWTSLEPLPAGAMDEWRERTLAGAWWQHPPGVPGQAAGIPQRLHRIRVIGNGQCPAALALAWKYLAPEPGAE